MRERLAGDGVFARPWRAYVGAAGSGTGFAMLGGATPNREFPMPTTCPKSACLAALAFAACSESSGSIDPAAEVPFQRDLDFYERGRSFPTGLMDDFAALVDWDRDGDLDTIGLSPTQFGNLTYDDPLLSLFENDGSGQFSPARTHELEGVRAVSKDIVDIDGDQDLEIFLFRTRIEGQMSTRTLEVHSIGANGDLEIQWTFTESQSCSMGCILPGIGQTLSGDFDGDGDLDFYLVTTFGPTIHVFHNQGDGTFVMDPDPVIAGLMASDAVRLFDLDEDGTLDLLVAGQDLALYRGLGADAYAPPIVYPLGVAGKALEISITELDGDGRLDLAVSKAGQYPELFVRQGAFDLLPLATNFPRWVAGTKPPLFIDLRGTGADDLFVGNALWLNDGMGGFTDASDRLPGDPPTGYSGFGGFESLLAGHAGDVDQDGDLDLWSPSSGRVLLQDASGHFGNELPPSFTGFVGAPVTPILAGISVDFDGDGIPDGLVQNLEGNQRYSVILRDALGGFELLENAFPETDFEWNPRFFDIDGDDDIDVLFGSSGHVFLNDGGGRFDASDANTDPLERTYDLGVVLEDFDGDGDRDLFHAKYEAHAIGTPSPDALYLRESDGTWTSAPLPEVETLSWQAVCGDLDGDGHRDVMVRSGQIYLSGGDGTFGLGADLFAGTYPTRSFRLNLGDVDSDGDVDVALGGIIYENEGDGTFSTERESGIDRYSLFEGFTDLDADGDVDAAGAMFFYLSNIHWAGPRLDIWANDGSGFFERERIAVPREGVGYADVDGDGDLDLFMDDTILLSRTRSLEVEPTPRVGQPIRVELYGEPFEAFRVVATRELGARGDGVGALRIDLDTSVLETTGSLDASGRATLSLAIPGALDADGTVLFWQAMTSSQGLWTAVDRSVLRTF